MSEPITASTILYGIIILACLTAVCVHSWRLETARKRRMQADADERFEHIGRVS